MVALFILNKTFKKLIFIYVFKILKSHKIWDAIAKIR